MRVISREGVKVRYEARFWEGPTEPGQSGRRVTRVCDDLIVDRLRIGKDGRMIKIGERLLNTARNVSYYGQLEKALRIKWGEERGR